MTRETIIEEVESLINGNISTTRKKLKRMSKIDVLVFVEELEPYCINETYTATERVINLLY